MDECGKGREEVSECGIFLKCGKEWASVDES